MKKMGTAPMVFRLALVCLGTLLISGLAYSTASGAQTRGRDDVPEELWQIYPLDPTKKDAGARQTAQVQPPPPAPQAQTNSAVQQRQKAQAQPTGESGSGRSLAFPLLVVLLALIVGLLVAAAGRTVRVAIAGQHRVHGDSALESPSRALRKATRHVAGGGATVVSSLRALSRLSRRIGSVLMWPLRASAGVLSYVVRRVASTGKAARQASRRALHAWSPSRSPVIFYALAVLISFGLALLIQIFLTS